MADEVCSERGIPARLHTDKRIPDPVFKEGEKLFRRFRGDLDDENLHEAISFDIGESFNRSEYCDSPADVLLDCEHGKHFEGFGVISFSVQDLAGKSWECEDRPAEVFTYAPKHKPESCNYAHTELSILLNGETIRQVRKAVRRKVRKAIVGTSEKLRGLSVPLQ